MTAEIKRQNNYLCADQFPKVKFGGSLKDPAYHSKFWFGLVGMARRKIRYVLGEMNKMPS